MLAGVALAVGLGFSRAAAQQPVPAAATGGKPKVVSLSTVLTDVAREVGGDKIDLIPLIQPGMDPHGFSPTPADAQKVSSAQLVLISGKGLEGYLTKFKQAAGGKAVWLDAGAVIPTITPPEHDHDHDDGDHDHHHHDADPHWWHSVANVKLATVAVRDALSAIAPADKAFFAQRATDYLAKLDTLEKELRVELAALPRDSRKLVTSHDAFQYFAKEYGFTIISISGISTKDQPSSRKITRIMEEIKKHKVKAVFYESIENPKVIEEITKETGAKVGGSLYADGLGEGDASTYIGMMKANVATVVKGLK